MDSQVGDQGVIAGLVAMGVPVESIAIILGIDRLLDMCRTTLSVTGDLVGATLVAKGEPGEAAATDESLSLNK